MIRQRCRQGRTSIQDPDLIQRTHSQKAQVLRRSGLLPKYGDRRDPLSPFRQLP